MLWQNLKFDRIVTSLDFMNYYKFYEFEGVKSLKNIV